MSFASLLNAMTVAACRGDGAATAACFTPDGVYHDYFHRDARDFRWDLHDVVDNGSLGYARYVFSYESKLPGCEGQRALFEGVSICELRDGRLLSYREVANSAVGLHSIGFPPARVARFLAREAQALAQRPEAQSHLAT